MGSTGQIDRCGCADNHRYRNREIDTSLCHTGDGANTVACATVSERVWPTVRVRPVRGRVIDPFRGALHDEDPERFADRAIDAQPLEDVLAAMNRLPDVRIVRTGRRFTLGRGHDVAKVSFASAARTVSLADTTFEGDGAMILALLHGWLPLFGAVEVRIGSHRELIDGHEPLDAIVKRYETWWVDESLLLAKKLSAQPPAAPVQAAPPIARRRAVRWQAAVIGILLAGILIAWKVSSATDRPTEIRRNEVGEHCERNADCWGDCLPQFEGSPIGVCTQYCATDSECPTTMHCNEVYMVSQVVGTKTRTRRCVPNAW